MIHKLTYMYQSKCVPFCVTKSKSEMAFFETKIEILHLPKKGKFLLLAVTKTYVIIIKQIHYKLT